MGSLTILVMTMEDSRRKPLLEEFAVPAKGYIYARNCSKSQQSLKCLCEDDDQVGFNCFKCGSYTHTCLERQLNRGDCFECAPCINRAMDPIFTVRKVLVESYFKIVNIFESLNQITFEFTIGSEDLFYPVEIRALKPGYTYLSYPMQGIVELNQKFLHEFRPLKLNSNRKSRREEFLSIPSDKLRLGKNIVRFRIPVLDRIRYKENFKAEQHAVYYLSINSIEQINKQTLIRETFSRRRLDKNASIALLTEENGEIQVTQTKLSLICPYTKERIKVPVRGRYCKHFTCVCLETLIASHVKSRFWGCPICDHKIAEPFVDIWIYGMLKDNRQGTDVLVHGDGSYSWVNKHTTVVELDSSGEDQLQLIPQQEAYLQPASIGARFQPEEHFAEVMSIVSEGARVQNWPEVQARTESSSENRLQAMKKMIHDRLKEKIRKSLAGNIQEAEKGGPDKNAPLEQLPVKVMRVEKKPEYKGEIAINPITDIRELRVKEQSYDSFRNKYLANQLVFAKKMRSFFEQYPNLKSTFKEILN